MTYFKSHLKTMVVPVDGTHEESVKKALIETRKEINEYKKNQGEQAPVEVGGNLQEIKEMIEENRANLSEEEIEMLLASAHAAQADSSVRRLPMYNWMHLEPGTVISSNVPKQTALYINIPVQKEKREELGFDKWPVYPLKDKDKLPYYDIFMCAPEPHYYIKMRNNIRGIECTSQNFRPSFLGGPEGTPIKRVPEIHGAADLTNFCKGCKHAPHNTGKDTPYDEKCKMSRVVIVYVVGQSAGVDSDSKAKTSPVVVGPLMLELQGVILYEFFKKGSPASGKYPKIDGLLKYRLYKEDIPKSDKFKKVAKFVGKEDGDKVIESKNSLERICANLINTNGIKWYKDIDARAKAQHASEPDPSGTVTEDVVYDEVDYDEEEAG